jgi:(p)ppGpp synthase/HD superfamily hydrolase
MKIIEIKKFVKKAHHPQLRKYPKNTPYYTHLFRVANILSENNFDKRVVIAGLLHDLVEDTEYELEFIEKNYGKDIAKYVDFVSEDKSLPWKERKEKYIERLFSKDSPIESIVISMADKIDNLEDIGRATNEIGDEFFNKYMGNKKYQRWFYNLFFEKLTKHIHKNKNKDIENLYLRLENIIKKLSFN